ncbi:hypothetical protein GCM10011588_59650 [Nocardia jinanensis]|uniref:Uncharacterized protein n=1 Tax=Nocardia jinanensis TaxID=382504 RepID=A0A917RWF1_9NOCA|nr:hypothetical protein GCM10011588_59650 [Nocardia jinanensis]
MAASTDWCPRRPDAVTDRRGGTAVDTAGEPWHSAGAAAARCDHSHTITSSTDKMEQFYGNVRARAVTRPLDCGGKAAEQERDGRMPLDV